MEMRMNLNSELAKQLLKAPRISTKDISVNKQLEILGCEKVMNVNRKKKPMTKLLEIYSDNKSTIKVNLF